MPAWTWTVRDGGRLHDAPGHGYVPDEFRHSSELIVCHVCRRLITIARREDIPPDVVRWQCNDCHDKALTP